jgi:hypothetical protein
MKSLFVQDPTLRSIAKRTPHSYFAKTNVVGVEKYSRMYQQMEYIHIIK